MHVYAIEWKSGGVILIYRETMRRYARIELIIANPTSPPMILEKVFVRDIHSMEHGEDSREEPRIACRDVLSGYVHVHTPQTYTC